MQAGRSSNKPRVALISLGCAKNLVDSELMLGALLGAGFELVSDTTQADALVINTCAFIDPAQEESVDTILECAAARKAGRRGQALIVAGCLPQRFRDELPGLLPEVDAFMGVDQIASVGEIVRLAIARRVEEIRNSKSEILNKSRAQNPKSSRAGRFAKAGQRRQTLAAEDSAKSPARDTFGRPATEGTPQPGSRSTRQPAPLVFVHPRPGYIPDHTAPRLRLTPAHFAYVKIAEGCNHPCSFCTIPRIRGRYRSRPQADILAEAKALLADGVKELNLISQDSTFYGLDLRPGCFGGLASPERFASAVKSLPPGATTICTLLRALNDLPGQFWIRLLYTHPAHWTDELVETIATCHKVARYVDIPLQHIHDDILQRMRRQTSRRHIVELIRKIRTAIPGIAIRTTFIVGFPGETDACFQELLDFINETKFERLGVFAYSQQIGTPAAKMADQIPDRTKQRRLHLALTAQRRISRQIAKSFVGRVVKVLVEGRANPEQLKTADAALGEHGTSRELGDAKVVSPKIQNFLVARSEADAPDIDGRVFIRDPKAELPIGRFARVKVVGHTDYDLIAEPVG